MFNLSTHVLSRTLFAGQQPQSGGFPYIPGILHHWPMLDAPGALAFEDVEGGLPATLYPGTGTPWELQAHTWANGEKSAAKNDSWVTIPGVGISGPGINIPSDFTLIAVIAYDRVWSYSFGRTLWNMNWGLPGVGPGFEVLHLSSPFPVERIRVTCAGGHCSFYGPGVIPDNNPRVVAARIGPTWATSDFWSNGVVWGPSIWSGAPDLLFNGYAKIAHDGEAANPSTVSYFGFIGSMAHVILASGRVPDASLAEIQTYMGIP